MSVAATVALGDVPAAPRGSDGRDQACDEERAPAHFVTARLMMASMR